MGILIVDQGSQELCCINKIHLINDLDNTGLLIEFLSNQRILRSTYKSKVIQNITGDERAYPSRVFPPRSEFMINQDFGIERTYFNHSW